MAERAKVQRRSPGVVRDAIIEVMKARKPMSCAEVGAAASSLLGEEIPPTSIRSYLRLNSKPGGTFKRHDKRGTYSLR